MKPFLSTFILLISISTLFAQHKEDVKTDPNNLYGEGGKKVTRIVQRGNGTPYESFKIYDQNETLREIKYTDTDKEGNVTVVHAFYDCEGKETYSERKRTDKAGEEYYYEQERFSKGRQIAGYKSQKASDGTLKEFIYDAEQSKYREKAGEWEKIERLLFKGSYDVCANPDDEGFEVSAGYGYLNADFEPENKGMHGWGTGFYYGINKHWDVGIKGSGHYKKEDNVSFSKHFIHAVVQYQFDPPGNGQPKISPFIEGGAGMAFFKSTVEIPGFPKAESKDKSFSPTIGAGIDWNISKKLAARVEASYLPTRFGDDDTQHNFILYTGVALGFGRN